MDVTIIRKKFQESLVTRISHAFKRWKRSVLSVCTRIWQVGADDHRKVIHSIKVGLALSLVSVFYFVRPMFDTFGGNAIWAVVAVILAFEFTVGATLSKGLNISCASFLAGFLGIGVSDVAELTGKRCELVILGVSIFVIGAWSTYARFFPIMIKKKYDYVVLVFILTYNLIAIASYRAENIFKMAYQQMSMIVIGCALSFAINLIIFPVWAGDDLHNSILCNMEGLAKSLEECVTKYFVELKDCQESGYDEVPRACKFVVNSKATEESLASFAIWEPPHGRFFFRYPWNLYEKVGNMTRHCAYCVKALHEFSKSEIQAPFEVRENLKTSFIDMGREAANILRELAERIRKTRRSKSPHLMMDQLRAVVENLQSSLKLQPELFINSKRWIVLEEKPLRVPQNFLEGLTRTENLQAFSIPKPAKQADLINRGSIGISMQKEGVQTDTSRDRAAKICEMREMKQSSCSFMEILPLVSFSALLIETVAKLESLMMAVEELEEVIFRNIDSR